MNKSINNRIGNHNCHNPVLRWETGRAAETLCMESGLVPADDNLDNEIDYSDPFAIWGDDGNTDMLDDPISDENWAQLLECVGIR